MVLKVSDSWKRSEHSSCCCLCGARSDRRLHKRGLKHCTANDLKAWSLNGESLRMLLTAVVMQMGGGDKRALITLPLFEV